MTSEDEPVGSVGEEAAKLFGALQDWARENKQSYAGHLDDLASAAASVNEHIATGGQDCRYCPVCQTISTVRATSPEVKRHLASAAASLLQALLAATEAGGDGSRRRDAPVERIDLTDEAWDED